MDFETQNYYLQLGIGWIWGISTALACVPMFYAFTYIVVEWCLQSHLSTVDYDAARRGLRITRKFRSLVQPFRNIFHALISCISLAWRCLPLGHVQKPKIPSLRWTSSPKLKISISEDVEDQPESAVEDDIVSGGSQDVGLLTMNYLASPGRSLNRSPRSSFGQDDGKELFRPKSFN